MKKLTDLFKIIELTRDVPQYGYALSGIQLSELSNLAEHQYLVTFFAWQLALYLKQKGANINVQKVMEISMVHDVGEILGGDISFYYGRANPPARKAAKAFEQENLNYISKFFGNPQHFLELHKMERGEIVSDEAIVERFGDLLESIHFKLRLNRIYKDDIKQISQDLKKLVIKAKDPILKKELAKFITEWQKSFPKGHILDILRGQK
jgi:5'-deoxynucleotidase YfbR-like HD superfamily hydrolase